MSEWSTPIERGGVKTQVGEYSISVVGPGPRATATGSWPDKAGVRTMAKTQFNNTWEISAVPYIPVPNLIARHCATCCAPGSAAFRRPGRWADIHRPTWRSPRNFTSRLRRRPPTWCERVAVRRYGRRRRRGAASLGRLQRRFRAISLQRGHLHDPHAARPGQPVARPAHRGARFDDPVPPG